MKIKPKSREEIKDAVDIVLNTEEDGAAVQFLQETLTDHYPDMDLGTMDLHKAINILGGDEPEKSKKKTGFENLGAALEIFQGTKKKKKTSRRGRGSRK